MALTSGTKLGPYEIQSPLGAGGMGEVYRARDTRLERDVAIKVSSEQFTERFERCMTSAIRMVSTSSSWNWWRVKRWSSG